MKIAATLPGMLLTLLLGGSVLALDNHALQPVSEAPGEAEIELFPHVKYKDLDEMHPCAVTKIVAVKDPCACRDACDCCSPACVHIQICVPPPCECECECECETVQSRKGGDRVRYDYGEYAVDIRVKDGYIEVDYQD